MNIVFVLVSMCLLCVAIGLYVGVANNSARRRQKGLRPESTGSARGNSQRLGVPGGTLISGSMVSAHGKRLLLAVSAIGYFSLAVLPASAQEVIHARAGTVIAVSKDSKTITLKASDGTTVMFAEVPASNHDVSLAKEILEKTVPAVAFDKVGDQVVVFYYGFNNPTAVAIKDLGAAAVKRNTGSVANFERHQRLLTLKTDAVEPQKVTVTDDTVVDTANGVIKPGDYHPNKGEQVRFISALEKNPQTALLVGPN